MSSFFSQSLDVLFLLIVGCPLSSPQSLDVLFLSSFFSSFFLFLSAGVIPRRGES